MSEKKDWWERIEILGKIIVPIAVGLMLLFWNSQRTTQQTAAAMTQIAIGILSEEPAADDSDSALRLWAIEVLKEPSSVPRLTEDAALQLEKRPLPYRTLEIQKELVRIQSELLPVIERIQTEQNERLQELLIETERLLEASPLGEGLQ